MELAVAEKGLIVFDLSIKGTPSHAAHPNEDNPLMKISQVIEKIKNISFDKNSPLLGPVKLHSHKSMQVISIMLFHLKSKWFWM